jgi:hypothetical protein
VDPIMTDDPEIIIRKQIKTFKLPGKDALAECLLALSSEKEPVWDAAIFVSLRGYENYYPDIFHFWVRAFYSFLEATRNGKVFHQLDSSITCRQISPEDFRRNYMALLMQRIQDPYFLEQQAFSQTKIELENRTFSTSYVIVDRPDIKSSVAQSGKDYVAYFVITNPSKLIRLVSRDDQSE